jgi:Protein of unknown function (DUF1236)
MRERLLITTAIGLMLGTGAFAQSPSEQPKTNAPPAAQSQTNSNSSAPANSSSTSSPSSTPAQNAQSTPSQTPKSATTTSPSAPNTTGANDSSHSQAQTNQPSTSSARSDSNTTTAPSQAQSVPSSNSSNQAQTNTAPPANNQTQSSPTGAANNNAANNPGAPPTTNAGAPPSNNQTDTAQSRSSNINVSANLNEKERTRVSASISRLNARPVTNVNFSLSVGTVVPRDVYFQPLPADVVEVLPQYRGYNFIIVRDDIVIVEPSTYKIVDVLPRGGHSTAAAAPSRKTTFSDKDREVIRKHARSFRTEQRTTGSSAASTRVRVGDRLPDSVEVRSFPDEVYRGSPALREYRYIERDNRTYVVEPHERTIIEEID